MSNEANEALGAILAVIHQESEAASSCERVFGDAVAAIARLGVLLGNIHSNKVDGAILVPDTNALLHNPAIEEWLFADFPKFVVLLVPVVLSELDQLKVSGKAESVRTKSESLIKRFKEFRRRGSLSVGVTVRKDVSTLRTLAREPDFSKTLSWLNPDNNDDRLLAYMFEVMRQYPQSPVVLITRDFNLQNKAEYASCPFIEPPDPTPPTAA